MPVRSNYGIAFTVTQSTLHVWELNEKRSRQVISNLSICLESLVLLSNKALYLSGKFKEAGAAKRSSVIGSIELRESWLFEKQGRAKVDPEAKLEKIMMDELK